VVASVPRRQGVGANEKPKTPYNLGFSYGLQRTGGENARLSALLPFVFAGKDHADGGMIHRLPEIRASRSISEGLVAGTLYPDIIIRTRELLSAQAQKIPHRSSSLQLLSHCESGDRVGKR
jgi:hypothetical protein